MSKNKQSINVLRANLKKLRATTAAIFLIEEINIEGNRRDILKAIVAKWPFCGKETPIEVDTDTLEEFLVDPCEHFSKIEEKGGFVIFEIDSEPETTCRIKNSKI